MINNDIQLAFGKLRSRSTGKIYDVSELEFSVSSYKEIRKFIENKKISGYSHTVKVDSVKIKDAGKNFFSEKDFSFMATLLIREQTGSNVFSVDSVRADIDHVAFRSGYNGTHRYENEYLVLHLYELILPCQFINITPIQEGEENEK